MIAFKRLNEDATTPTRGTEGSAGFDLYYSGLPTELEVGGYALFDTGIQMSLPKDRVGNIKPRSGLAVKYGIDTMAGVIDSDYRGEIKVILINHGKSPVTFRKGDRAILNDFSLRIRKGDRIAQLVVTTYHADVQEVMEELETTARGEGGFGSTGR